MPEDGTTNKSHIGMNLALKNLYGMVHKPNHKFVTRSQAHFPTHTGRCACVVCNGLAYASCVSWAMTPYG